MEVYYYFIAILLLQIYPLKKVLKFEDLNIFDLLMLVYSLYFVLTPIRCILADTIYREESVQKLVESTPAPSIDILFVMILFWLFDIFFTNVYIYRLRFVYITEYIRNLNEQFELPKKSIFYFIGLFIITLIPLVSFSDLTTDDVEGNITIFYGQDLPLGLRLMFNMIAGTFSCFVILTLKYRISAQDLKWKLLADIAILILLSCVLLRGRTNMVNTCALGFLYIYSIRISPPNLKLILASILAFSVVIFLIFPQYQTFRLTKQYMVMTKIHHSFSDVLHTYLYEDIHDLKDLAEDQARSFNVYAALLETHTIRYQKTGGGYLLDQLHCAINPLYTPSPKYENFVADNLEGGGDIAESMPTVMNFDIGFKGLFFVPIYYVLYGVLLWLISFLFHRINRRDVIWMLFIIMFIEHCLRVEGSVAFRTVYNPGVIVIGVFTILAFLFCVKAQNRIEQELIDEEIESE